MSISLSAVSFLSLPELLLNLVTFREGDGTPLQSSCLANPMNGGAWWAAVDGVTKSQTRLSDFTFTSLSCIGEGNGNPLQYSCLENPRDEGAWWAAVYGVVQSRTRLKRLSSSSSSSSDFQIISDHDLSSCPQGFRVPSACDLKVMLFFSYSAEPNPTRILCSLGKKRICFLIKLWFLICLRLVSFICFTCSYHLLLSGIAC